MMQIPANADVDVAAERMAGIVRPVTVVPADPGVAGPGVYLALEFMQHTGSFKARGPANLIAARLAEGSLPPAGIVTTVGGNAVLGCAWAAARYAVPATVFLPEDTSQDRIARLRALGAQVRLTSTWADAVEAAGEYAESSGAIDAFGDDEILLAAGAGTLLPEIVAAVPDLDTVVVAVGGGGMFAGVTAAADHRGIRVVAAEPTGCRALNAALEAGRVVDVPAESIAADSLGALRVSAAALALAQTADVYSATVDDAAIVRARRLLWAEHRLAIEHGSATTLAALLSGAYRPRDGEKIALVLCGANTDPADLARPQAA